MEEKDKEILDLMKGNARISYQELGDAIGMSRVAAKKRVMKLENEGIIRGYNTCIYREGEVTLFIDIVTAPGKYEKVLEYVSTRTAFIRQIYKTTKENHIHIVAVSDSITDLRYLMRMIRKKCGDDIQAENKKKNDVLKTYADGNERVHQLIDLALLQNGMLKGEALTRFVKRSVEMIK